jgi:hypothetical protein
MVGMEEQRRSRGRPAGTSYTRRYMVYEDDEGMALVEELARVLGVSKVAAVRLAVREKAQQLGIKAKG